MLLHVIGGFFSIVLEGAGVLGYKLTDLIWENVGITANDVPTVQARARHPGNASESAHASSLCCRGASGRGASVCVDGGRCVD